MTYREIQERVRRRTGQTVKTCWIAEVKRELALTTRTAWNSGRGKGAPPCPPHLKEAIRRCLVEGSP